MALVYAYGRRMAALFRLAQFVAHAGGDLVEPCKTANLPVCDRFLGQRCRDVGRNGVALAEAGKRPRGYREAQPLRDVVQRRYRAL